MRERAVLERLLARTEAADPQRAEVLSRLVMTIEEIVRQHRATAGRLDEPIHRASQAGNAADERRLRAQQEAAQADVVAGREAAVRALAQLVAGFPNRPHLDASLNTLALLLEEMGESRRARQVYHRILRDHPESRFVPHAYLAFAEWRFAEGELDDAGRFYERVLTIDAERNDLYGYALYKLAWVRYNQARFQDALNAFVGVLEYTSRYSDRSSSSALARQARRELVLPYAETGRPDRALRFFRRFSASDAEALSTLESLAQVYTDTGRWADSVVVHHRLMASAPDSDSLCAWQQRVLEATIASQPKRAQVTEARRLLDVRNVFREAAHPAARRASCEEETATTLLLLSTAWHREAVGTEDQPGTRDRATMQRASELYDLVVSGFPDLAEMRLPRIDRRDRPSAAQIAAYQGELLYELQAWTECASAFERSLDASPTPQVAANAAYGAVLCYDRHLGSREPPPTADDRALTPREFDESEARMAHTFQRFVCAAPEHEELPVVLYRWARLHFEANQLERASVLFRRVALDHARSEVAEYAANLYLDSVGALAERRGREACFATLEEDLGTFERAYCANPEQHPALCETVDTLHCQLPARRVEHMSGPPAQQARILLALVRERTCPQAPQYLFNAAIYFEQARLLGAAIRVRSVLIEQYPGHALARRAIYMVGGNYHALAIYEEAASWYERYVREGGQCDADATAEPCPDASVGLRHAVRFRLGLGQSEEALSGARTYQRRYGRAHPRVAANVAFEIGSVHERAQAWPRVVDHYRALLRQHARQLTPGQRAAANVTIARAWIRQDQRARAEGFLRTAVGVHESGGEAAVASLELEPAEQRAELFVLRNAVAEARYELAEGLRIEYEGLRFPSLRGGGTISRVNRWAQRDLSPWVLRKQRMIAEAEAAYALVAPLGIPRWRIAAASRLGDMYLSLVQQVRRSPIPDAIARYPEAVAAYEDALDRVTEEPAGVAISRYQSCLTTATSVRWFDDRSRRCETALHQLDAVNYPIASELRGSPTYEPQAPARPGAPRLQDPDPTDDG